MSPPFSPASCVLPRTGIMRFMPAPPHTNKDGAVIRVKDPRRGTILSAGVDLFMPDDVDVRPLETATVDTDMIFAFPLDVFGLILLRSSAANLGISVKAGVIGEL